MVAIPSRAIYESIFSLYLIFTFNTVSLWRRLPQKEKLNVTNTPMFCQSLRESKQLDGLQDWNKLTTGYRCRCIWRAVWTNAAFLCPFGPGTFTSHLSQPHNLALVHGKNVVWSFHIFYHKSDSHNLSSSEDALHHHNHQQWGNTVNRKVQHALVDYYSLECH